MMRCLLVDDEPLARQLLADFVSKIADMQVIGSCKNALEASLFLKENETDVLFLDIQMPDLNGLDFLQNVKQKPLTVLTTAYAEHALKAYELDVVDYLLKPFDFNRFYLCIEKLRSRQVSVNNERQFNEFFFVKDGSTHHKVEIKQLQFIQGAKEYVIFYCTDKKVMGLYAMKELEKHLPENFVRVHISYIINVNAVNVYNKESVSIAGKSIPISQSYREIFQRKVEQFKLKS
ncbi:MAG: LytR/AlgR family response regulator transcription factor [Chryseotalea sp.]|jgi:two-component system LytT family response regulator|nr:response regulator transcription factor [Flammeovirgaceae bacterium]